MNKFAIVFVTGADAVQGWFDNFNPWFSTQTGMPITENEFKAAHKKNDARYSQVDKIAKAREKETNKLLDRATKQANSINKRFETVGAAIDRTDYTTNPKHVDALLLQARNACLPIAPTGKIDRNRKVHRGRKIAIAVVPEAPALPEDVDHVTKNILPDVERKAETVGAAKKYMTGDDKTKLAVLEANIITIKNIMTLFVSSKDFERNKLGLLTIDARLNQLATNQMHAVKPLFLVKPQEGEFKTKWELWKGKVVEAGQKREGKKPDLETFKEFVALAEESHELANDYIKEMKDSVFSHLENVKLINFNDVHSGLGDWRIEYNRMKQTNESKTVFEIAKGLESMYSTAEFFFLDQKFQTLLTKSKGQPNEAIINQEKRWYNIAAKNWRALDTQRFPAQTNVEQKYTYYKETVAEFEAQAGTKVTQIAPKNVNCVPENTLAYQMLSGMPKWVIDFTPAGCKGA